MAEEERRPARPRPAAIRLVDRGSRLAALGGQQLLRHVEGREQRSASQQHRQHAGLPSRRRRRLLDLLLDLPDLAHAQAAHHKDQHRGALPGVLRPLRAAAKPSQAEAAQAGGDEGGAETQRP